MRRPHLFLLLLAMTLLVTADAGAQSCAPNMPVTADQQVRRDAAARFLDAVNAAESKARLSSGAYAALPDLPDLPSVPVGFVPRLTADQWSYVISLKDLFDACGVALFTDSSGAIYEARPVTVVASPGDSNSGTDSAPSDAGRPGATR